MLPRAMLVCLAVVAGCGEEPEPARRVGHRPIFASGWAIYDVSIARDEEGATVVAWTTGDLGNGDPAWMVPGSGEVHHAGMVQPEFGPASRFWSSLVPVDGGFVRLVGQAAGATPIHSLEIDSDASLVSFVAIPDRWAPANPTLEAVSFRGRPIVAATNGIDVVVHGIDPPWRVLVSWSNDCLLDDDGEDQRATYGSEDTVRISRSPDDTAVVIGLRCPIDGSARRWAGLVRLEPGKSTPEQPYPLPEGVGTDDDLLAAAATRSALGTLWLTQGGSLRFFAQALDEDELDLSEAVFEIGGAQGARLFASERAFVVTYRLVDGTTVSEQTTAVTIDPQSATVTEPYEWPLSDSDCPISSYVPTSAGLDYACVGRCQGAGCATRWLYQGSVELD